MAEDSPLYVTVLYDFTYVDNDGRTICIRPGEKYILEEKSNDDWWHVQSLDSEELLYVPASYVEVEKTVITVTPDNVTHINLGSPTPVRTSKKKYPAPLPPTFNQHNGSTNLSTPKPDYDDSPDTDLRKETESVDHMTHSDPSPDYFSAGSPSEDMVNHVGPKISSSSQGQLHSPGHMATFRPLPMVKQEPGQYEPPEDTSVQDIKAFMGLHPPDNLERSRLDSSENWEKHLDQNTGQVYYYNVVTRQTSWTLPEPDNPSDETFQDHLESPKQERPPLLRGYSQEQDQSGEFVYVSTATNEKWYCSTDEKGTTYYYNASGDTRWVLPEPESHERRYSHESFFGHKHSSRDLRCTRVGSFDDLVVPRRALPTVVESRASTLPSNFEQPSPECLPLENTSRLSLQKFKESLKRESKRASSPPMQFQIRSLRDNLNRAKVLENGRKVKKNWCDTFCVFNGSQLLFYKDRKASVGSPKSPLGKAETMIDLQNGKVEWGDKEKSSKKHFIQVSTPGNQYLLQSDDALKIHEWYLNLSAAVAQFNSDVPDSVEEGHPVIEAPDEPQTAVQRSSRGRHSKNNKKETYTLYEDPDMDTLEKKSRIRARLRDMIRRRPTMESLEKRGILQEERVFGAHLHHLCAREKSTVPRFVQKCIAVIENKGLDIDGLYRVSGNLAQVQKLRFLVDQCDTYDLERSEFSADVHVLTGALKLFFRELKEPLFPFTFLDNFIGAIKQPDRSSKLQLIKGLVQVLPRPSHDTLKELCRHLLVVCSHQDQNRMGLSNLAIVFGPTLMWPEKDSPNLAVSLMYQSSIVEFILFEFNNIF